MIYINIVTNAANGVTCKNQLAWLEENIFSGFKHIGTFGNVLTCPQFNKWRFESEEDAMAFRLAWEGA